MTVEGLDCLSGLKSLNVFVLIVIFNISPNYQVANEVMQNLFTLDLGTKGSIEKSLKLPN